LISPNVIVVPVTPYESDQHGLRGPYGHILEAKRWRKVNRL